MASLPAEFPSEDEQIRLIAELSEENDKLGVELEQALASSGENGTLLDIVTITRIDRDVAPTTVDSSGRRGRATIQDIYITAVATAFRHP